MIKARIKIAIKDIKIIHVSELRKTMNVYTTMTLFHNRILNFHQLTDDYFCAQVKCQINQGDDIVKNCWDTFRDTGDPEIFKCPQYLPIDVLKRITSKQIYTPKNQNPLEEYAFEIIGEQYTVPLRGLGTFAEIVDKFNIERKLS